MNQNNLNINTELRQQLKLTPEMKLGLDVLQATHLELRDILNNEMQENPLIEDLSLPEVGEEEKHEEQDKEKAEDAELPPEETYLDRQDHFEHEHNPEDEKIADYHYNSIAQEENKDLQEFLTEQLDELHLNNELHAAAYTIILNINDKGLFEGVPDDLSAQSGIPVETMKKALEIIRGFQPAGVGAVTAAESILNQMRRNNMKDTLAYRIVDKNFDELEKQHYRKLSEINKVTEEDVLAAVKIIGEYEPFPGMKYGVKDKTEYVVPDVIIDEEEGGFKVSMPDEMIDIKINSKYLNLDKKDKKMREFTKKYEERIRALLHSLEERKKTIKKVVERIIDIQKDYLKEPEKGLHPLTLREIASSVGVHESTVSRIVSKKYLQTPGGVFPLKTFFSSKLQTSGGEISSSSAREKMKLIIKNESKSSPFTDTEIAEKLNLEGIRISRRTVTKYREQMDIPPVNIRKK